MGSIEPLHVRVDIDETETWRVRPGRHALARLPQQSRNLSAAHPYPLRALCPAKTVIDRRYDRARRDTRVLQVIYAFPPDDFPAFVGQQVDVFIAAPSRGAATRQPTSGENAFGPASGARVQIAGGIGHAHR